MLDNEKAKKIEDVTTTSRLLGNQQAMNDSKLESDSRECFPYSPEIRPHNPDLLIVSAHHSLIT